MPLSREAVIYAYRYLLNRDPESEAVIENCCQLEDWQALRRAFIGSPEFRDHQIRTLLNGAQRIGRHIDIEHIPVDIRTTPDQLDAMLDRIASCWRTFGETEPHWSVLTNDDFKPDALQHHLNSFFAHGRQDVETLLRYISRAGLPRTFEHALDFGCGVGRLTIALTERAKNVVGADISRGHLREAEAECRRRGIENVDFKEISGIKAIDDLGSFDLIISRIVLQHNPPPVMAAIYRRLLRRLRSGGVAVIQMPTFINGQNFTANDYLASDIIPMEMNALPQREIFKIIANEGCIPLEVREDDVGDLDGVSHVFAVLKP